MKNPSKNQGEEAATPTPAAAGENRTGTERNPADARKLVEGAGAGVPQASLDAQKLGAARAAAAKQADTVGSPPRGRADSSGRGAIASDQKSLLLDFLGERLAFERTGTRLYEALLAKAEAAARYPGRPARAEVALLRDQELAHFNLLTTAIERLGGDATALSPSADVTGMVGNGLLQAITDARTTFTQALKVMVGVELMDKDAWETLVDIAERIGLPDLVASFQQAADQEEEHLAVVRTWLRRALENDAGFTREVPVDAAAAPAPPGS
jgi:rubrerythrin